VATKRNESVADGFRELNRRDAEADPRAERIKKFGAAPDVEDPARAAMSAPEILLCSLGVLAAFSSVLISLCPLRLCGSILSAHC
jgi:hypothetical protein